MSPEEAQRQARDMEAVRREMYRKSRNTIRIYNPLDSSVNYPQLGHNEPYVKNGIFVYYHDGYPNTIEPQQTKDVEAYKAEIYRQKITQFMIGQIATSRGEELLTARRKRGIPEFLDKYAENKEIWDKVPRTDDPVLAKEIAEQVIKGLVEEYGLELPTDFGPGNPVPAAQAIPQYVSSIFDRRVDNASAPTPKPLKEELAAEVTTNGD